MTSAPPHIHTNIRTFPTEGKASQVFRGVPPTGVALCLNRSWTHQMCDSEKHAEKQDLQSELCGNAPQAVRHRKPRAVCHLRSQTPGGQPQVKVVGPHTHTRPPSTLHLIGSINLHCQSVQSLLPRMPAFPATSCVLAQPLWHLRHQHMLAPMVLAGHKPAIC